MSADPPNSSGLPARSRPILSELAKQTTEEDLWDLDEEASDAVNPGDPADEDAEKPAAGIPEPQPEPPAPSAEKTPPPATSKTKPVVIEARLEKPASKKRSAARKEPERAKVTDAFDNLDIDIPDSRSAETPPAPASPPPDIETSKWEVEAPADEAPDKPLPPQPAPAPASGPKWRSNRREIIGLGIFSFVLLFAAIWGLAGFFGHLHFADSEERKVKFPVKGERTVIAAADSFWREPIREGPNRDAARSGTAFIPVVEISLAPESGSGALRLLFRNDKGAPVGDTITRTFSGGKFDTTGTERVECASSDGFSESGEFNAHQAGYSDPWTVLVLEGPGPDAPAREFSTLFELPLSTLRR